MSVSFGCKCEERKKPVKDRAWFVLLREHHCSAFAGYRVTPSKYSTVHCNSCGSAGRTKAAYVSELKDYEP